MAGWYFSVNGRAEGPVSEDILLDGLKSGRFTLVDLVFREGSAGWTTLGEIPEFRGAFEALPLPKIETPAPVSEVTGTDTPFDFTIALGSKPPPTEHRPTEHQSSPQMTENTPTDKLEARFFSRSVNTKIPPAPAWIVLKKKGSGFEQAGPYTEEQILERIGNGEVEYSMYAWKPGYKRWVRIGNLPEFDRRKRDRENDPVNQVVPLPKPETFASTATHAELAKSVEVQRRPDPVLPKFEPPPKETNGIDLANFSVQPPPSVAPQAMSFKIENAPAKKQDDVHVAPPLVVEEPPIVISAAPPVDDIVEASMTRIQRPPRAKRTGLPFYLRAAIALVFAGFVVVAVLAAAQWWTVQKAKEAARSEDFSESEQAARPSRNSSPSAPSAPTDDEPSPDETGRPSMPTAEEDVPVEEAPKKSPAQQARANAVNELGLRPIPPSTGGPTVLEIVPMKLGTANPILVFQTDAAVGETIDVTIRAKAGDILKWVSYSNNYLVRRGNGEIASLDLSKFSLPRGTYKVEASVGKIRKSASMFVGVRDADFETERRDHLKNISQIQQAEKKALFYSAQRLEKLTVELGDQSRRLKGQPSKWKKYYSDWKKQVKDGARPANGFARTDRPEMLAFPDLFNEFNEATGELADQAKQLDVSITQKRAIATVPLPVARSFKRLRMDASKLSAQ
ncbi:MAG: DUF4339 domain-containing protein [Bdellovibrionota bacterium]